MNLAREGQRDTLNYVNSTVDDLRYFPNGVFPSGHFPRVFSQVATSQGYFPKWQCPNLHFPKRKLPKSVLAAALGPKPILSATPGPLVHPSRSARPPIGKLYFKEILLIRFMAFTGFTAFANTSPFIELSF